MKKTILTVTACVAVMFTACKEKNADAKTTEETTNVEVVSDDATTSKADEFKVIEAEKVEALNKAIASKNLKSEDEIIAEYLPKESEVEGDKYKYDVTKIPSEDGKTLVHLVVEGNPDDSVEGIQVLMSVVKNDKGELIVEEIKESYRCHTDRGSQEWSSVICL